MNMWAFRAGFLEDQAKTFPDRMVKGVAEAPLKFEETISDAVQDILERNQGTVKCLTTDEQWFGMTYGEELSEVKERLSQLSEEGIYEQDKW